MSGWSLTRLPAVDRPAVDTFLTEQFGPQKGAFLEAHGTWWHQGDADRWVVVAGAAPGQIGAYYATTPACCLIDGEPVATLWWIDLVVDPAQRRQGLQRLMDDSVRGRPGLKLGIPNAFHATILARHGWQVRADSRKFLLPLRVDRLRDLEGAGGWRRPAARLGRWLAAPVLRARRRRWQRYRPVTARQEGLDTARLAAVAGSFHRPGLITACRREPFFAWRYAAAPYVADLRVYLAGPPQNPTHYLITRDVSGPAGLATRILDLYGDFKDQAALMDILRLALRDAVMKKAGQITAMAGPPPLRRALRRAGFWFTVPVHFCYHSTRPADMAALGAQPVYWTLGDSDNDAPA